MTRDEQIFSEYWSGEMVPTLAARYGLTKARVYQILDKKGGAIRPQRSEKAPREPRAPHKTRNRADGGVLRRFVGAKAEPSISRGLDANHPAVTQMRTLFPGNVVGTFDSPRFLVDGKNNSKIGGKVLKGPWSGFPVFTLTLEERATCPRSCPVLRECYGNAMQWPRRNDAFDPDFIPALAAEVVTVARQHPGGFVVRLHVLGDFYSVRYVRMWASLLDMLPMLHVYGYTARREDQDDEESRAIAAEIRVLREAQWSRFAVRTSHTEVGAERAIVVMEAVDDHGVIMCPSQVEKTATCGTCGLCWSENARNKTIAFLKHGIKYRHGAELVAKVSAPKITPKPAPRPVDVSALRARSVLQESASPSYHRTDADRLEPRQIVGATIMGDPRPGQPVPSRMTEAEILAHNAAIKRGFKG